MHIFKQGRTGRRPRADGSAAPRGGAAWRRAAFGWARARARGQGRRAAPARVRALLLDGPAPATRPAL